MFETAEPIFLAQIVTIENVAQEDVQRLAGCAQ